MAKEKFPTVEYQAFVRWYKATYGRTYTSRAYIVPGMEAPNIREDPYYKYWISIGRPGFKAAEEREFWELKPSEQEAAYEGLTKFPYESPPGLVWNIIKFDPRTQKPIKPRWELQPLPKAPSELPKIPPSWYEEQVIRLREAESAEAERRWNIEDYQRRQAAAQATNYAEFVRRAGAYEREATAQAGMTRGMEEGIRAQERATMYRQFEDMRREILSSAAPREWVVREKARLAPNPFEPQTISAGAEAGRVQDDLNLAQQEEKNASAAFKATSGRVTDDATIVQPWEVNLAQTRYENAVAKRQGLENYIKTLQPQVAEEQKWAQPRPTATGFQIGEPEAPYVPQKPQIPKELQQYFGIKEFGQPVEMPSGQRWAGAPWTGREQFMGYAESLGGQPRDILDYLERSLPRTPSIPGGWSPTRQR